VRELALGLAAAAGLHAVFLGGPPSGRRAPSNFSADTAVETVGFLSLGMRRLAADLGLIRMLVYYGTPEDESGHEGHGHPPGGHDAYDPAHPELSWGGGHYPELLARARAIRALDPRYDYPVFYAAGALAFNLNRPSQALDLLEEALRDDPGSAQLKAYVGAIGFLKQGDGRRVVEMLEPTLADPDCPTMIKMMLALMYRQQRRPADAVRLYREVLATSRDEGYKAQARHALSTLGAAPRPH
jgi:tetratricopeptide (TPR) repeat protein